jgi:hypothetical protein
METVSTHYQETLDTLAETLREQRRARFLLALTEDDGYFVAGPDLLDAAE